ncbi:MAG: ribosome small subunit-dependent GTPase A [Spirochaetales bacterium]|nr:ribosome small subunit-dependent GTPase A [Spirochaetales bacterium]
MNKNLYKLAWNSQWQKKYDSKGEGLDGSGFFPARISSKLKNSFMVSHEKGECLCEYSGKFRHHYLESRNFHLAPGDWVIIRQQSEHDFPLIHDYLERENDFSRKKAGKSSQDQLLSANLDFLLIVSTFDRDFRARRFERYLSLVNTPLIKPVIVLNKVDLVESPQSFISQLAASGIQAEMVVTSTVTGQGIEELGQYISAGKTACLVGSSGVGKSSLLNRLMGEDVQTTREIRLKDKRGRHTTCTRQLFQLPGGGVIIDNPGIKEIAMTGNEAGLEENFEDIIALAASCKFRDCRHEGEPGCAVQAALSEGLLGHERYSIYLELRNESRNVKADKAKWQKQLGKLQKQLKKEREKRYF